MWPIVLIAVGCALLLESDSPPPRRREPSEGDPPARPPTPPVPIPAVDAGSTPRGVNPALFRPTPPTLGPADFPTFEQARTELSGMFARGYTLNDQGELVVASQADADALQRRLGELRDIAFRDPRAAEAYDRREITKYVYLTLASLRPQDRGLLQRLDQGRITAADAVRQLDREELEFIRTFDGEGSPLDDPFYARHRALGFALREILSPDTFGSAGLASARTIVEGSELLNSSDTERRLRTTLSGATTSDLRAVLRYLSENMTRLEQALANNPPPATMPYLLREMRTSWTPGTGQALQRTALQMTTYISFALTVRGTTSLEGNLTAECREEFRGTDEAACSLRASLRLAAESPDEFDNARMRARLLEELGRYYAEYLSLPPAERIGQRSLLLEGELGQALRGGRFGPAFTAGDLQAVLSDVQRQLGATHVPPERGIPISWTEIRAVGEVPLEIRVDELPADLRELAGRINVSIPRAGGQPAWQGTLMDYLRQNVEVVVLTRRGPQLSADIGEPEATTNRLLRTVVIDIDGPNSTTAGDSDKPLYAILSTLAHEAYHNDYFHNLTPVDARLGSATTLNERNAHLLEAQVLADIMRLHLPEFRPLLEQARGGEEAIQRMSAADQRRLMQFNGEFEGIPPLYASHRLIGLSANVPLTEGVSVNHRLTDDRLWGMIMPEIRTETLGRYPTAFMSEYLYLRGLTQQQFMDQTQDELFRSMGLERPRPRPRPNPAPDAGTAAPPPDGAGTSAEGR